MKGLITFTAALAFSGVHAGYSQSTKTLSHSYTNVRVVKLDASGECKIERSPDDDLSIGLTYSYPEGEIINSFDQAGDSLWVHQKYHAPSVKNDGRWTITIPDNCRVRIVSANGPVLIRQIHADVDAVTASGDIAVNGARGVFRLTTHKGSIDIQNTDLSGPSWLTSSKGDIRVTASATLTQDLNLVTGSGDVELHLNKYPFHGSIQATANKKHGRIRIPFSNPAVNEDHENRDILVHQSYLVSTAEPVITLRSSDGSVVIERQ